MKLDKIISRIKGNPNYSFKNSYTNRELLTILWHRGFQLVRGSVAKLFWIKTNGIFFKGRNVNLRHAYNFKAGKNLILGDNVLIDSLSKNGVELGNNITIERNTIIVCTGVIANQGEGIKFGDNVAINANSFLGGQGGIEIKDNVIMGPSVQIFSENHEYQNLNKPIREQGETRKKVCIGANCWIGAGSIILSGVSIGSGVVVAAGSVVTKSFPNNVIVAGVPAKIIKKR